MRIFCCNENLTPFRRGFIGAFSLCLLSLVGVTYFARYVFERVHDGHFSAITGYVAAALSIIPISAIMFVIGAYLARERDEFIRALVVRSLLWGFGATMVADTVLGFLMQLSDPGRFALSFGIFNMDIFVVGAAVALRIQMWRNR